MKRHVAGALVALALALSGAAGTLALAAGAGNDERAQAESIVDEVSRDAPHKTLTAETLQHARDALERGRRMRAAGDEAHARLADGLALEWAETARDVVKAVDAEAAAADLRHKALDAQAQLERSRALVEEAIASIGRLQAELDQATSSSTGHAGHDHVAVEVHDGEVPIKDGGGKVRKGGGKAAPKKDVGGTP